MQNKPKKFLPVNEESKTSLWDDVKSTVGVIKDVASYGRAAASLAAVGIPVLNHFRGYNTIANGGGFMMPPNDLRQPFNEF